MNRYRIAFALLTALATTTVMAASESRNTDKTQHRFMIERTFPEGVLDGVDAAKKADVNNKNAEFDVKWVMSYVSADKTKTYCIYEAPNAESILKAAKANGLPVDQIMSIPDTLDPL
jgi:hypothetical protein